MKRKKRREQLNSIMPFRSLGCAALPLLFLIVALRTVSFLVAILILLTIQLMEFLMGYGRKLGSRNSLVDWVLMSVTLELQILMLKELMANRLGWFLG